MGETLFNVFLSDVKRVRLLCQKKQCGGVVELPISKLGSEQRCPVCAFSFPSIQVLGDLSDNFRILMEHEKAKEMKVEFVSTVKPISPP